jgi:hypothetical protein
LSGLVDIEICEDRPNPAVLMDVSCEMLPIAFDGHAEIQADTTKIMHPEPLPHLVVDLANQALDSNYEEIIDVQNHCSDRCALFLQPK